MITRYEKGKKMRTRKPATTRKRKPKSEKWCVISPKTGGNRAEGYMRTFKDSERAATDHARSLLSCRQPGQKVLVVKVVAVVEVLPLPIVVRAPIAADYAAPEPKLSAAQAQVVAAREREWISGVDK